MRENRGKMRVGIDLSFVKANHKNGGTEAQVKNIIKGLVKLQKACKTPEDFSFVCFIHRELFEEYRAYFPEVEFCVYDLPGGHALRTVRFQTRVLGKLLKENKVDLLYFPTFQTGLRRHWDVPVVVNPHDIQFKYYPEYFSAGKRAYYQLFYTNALVKADRIVAISDYAMQTYRAHFGKIVDKKITRIYNPVDLLRFEDGWKKEKVEGVDGDFILCVNSLTKHKNLITLVKAYEILVRSLRERGEKETGIPKLVLAGPAWNGENEISEYIRAHDLTKQVIVTGFLEEMQLAWLYNNAKVFVTTSLYEGFGMTPIEAMAAECPVISSKDTSLYEVTMGLATYYEPTTDPKALSQVIKAVLDKPPSPETLKRCRQAVQKYRPERVAAQYIRLWTETYEAYYK